MPHKRLSKLAGVSVLIVVIASIGCLIALYRTQAVITNPASFSPYKPKPIAIKPNGWAIKDLNGAYITIPPDWQFTNYGFHEQPIKETVATVNNNIPTPSVTDHEVMMRSGDYEAGVNDFTKRGLQMEIEATVKDAAFKSAGNDVYENCGSIKKYFSNSSYIITQLKLGTLQVCEVASRGYPSPINYYFSTSDAEYDLTLHYPLGSSSHQKDSYIGTAQQIIASIQLY